MKKLLMVPLLAMAVQAKADLTPETQINIPEAGIYTASIRSGMSRSQNEILIAKKSDGSRLVLERKLLGQ